jgi:hypothetical protein
MPWDWILTLRLDFKSNDGVCCFAINISQPWNAQQIIAYYKQNIYAIGDYKWFTTNPVMTWNDLNCEYHIIFKHNYNPKQQTPSFDLKSNLKVKIQSQG